VVDYSEVNRIIETSKFGRFTDYMAAASALDIDLPSKGGHRITATGTRVDGTTGVGFGYAYMNENGVAFKAGVSRAGGENIAKVGVSWEFGVSEPMKLAIVEVEAPPPPPPAVEEPEPFAEVLERQQIMEVAYSEDIEQVQMAQASMESRLEELEAKRAADAKLREDYIRKLEQQQAEDRAYALQTLKDLESYK
jgi:hypothetical protein